MGDRVDTISISSPKTRDPRGRTNEAESQVADARALSFSRRRRRGALPPSFCIGECCGGIVPRGTLFQRTCALRGFRALLRAFRACSTGAQIVSFCCACMLTEKNLHRSTTRLMQTLNRHPPSMTTRSTMRKSSTNGELSSRRLVCSLQSSTLRVPSNR